MFNYLKNTYFKIDPFISTHTDRSQPAKSARKNRYLVSFVEQYSIISENSQFT